MSCDSPTTLTNAERCAVESVLKLGKNQFSLEEIVPLFFQNRKNVIYKRNAARHALRMASLKLYAMHGVYLIRRVSRLGRSAKAMYEADLDALQKFIDKQLC